MNHSLWMAVFLFNATIAAAQAPADLPIDAARRNDLLAAAGQKYDSLYVFADKGRDIRARLNSKAVRARYESCATASCLADALTKDLQTWSGDKHLRLIYSVKPRPMNPTPAAAADQSESMKQRNHGFHNIERLHGNVGLIEIGRFDPAAEAAATAGAAMSFVANTDALIIDLRNNGGGNADMVAHLMSYFVPEQTHLATIKRRHADDMTQMWTSPHVPAPRYLGKPIYVLTGKRTFSAAEGLTYDLKHFASAVVVGEPTRGGANPGGFVMLDPNFAVSVPTGRMISAKTNSNWEGVGIKPDHEVPAANAIKIAHELALRELLRVRGESPRAAMWRQAVDEMFNPTTTSVAR